MFLKPNLVFPTVVVFLVLETNVMRQRPLRTIATTAFVNRAIERSGNFTSKTTFSFDRIFNELASLDITVSTFI